MPIGRGTTVERGFALRTYTPDPRLYEMVTILSPDVSEEDIPGQIDSIAGYVTTAGGNVDEILRESPWGRRRLAYTVRHAGRDIRDGFYTVFHITLDPSGVRDIERDLKLNDQVIRFLITHYTPKPVLPGQQTEGVPAAPPSPDSGLAANPGVETTTDQPEVAAEAPAADAIVDTTDAATVETEAPAPTESALAESETSGDVEPTGDVVTSDVAESASSETVAKTVDDAAPNKADDLSDAATVATSTDDDAPTIPDTTDTTVEADAAPAEPTAPAKDTEEA